MITPDGGVTPTHGAVLRYTPPAHPLITGEDPPAQPNRNHKAINLPVHKNISVVPLNCDTNQPLSCQFPSWTFVLGDVSAITIFNERGDIEF